MSTHLVKKHVVMFITFSFLLYMISKYTSQLHTDQNNIELKNTSNNILDGCYHVYLDVGSNIGVQVRKLFEPEKYPRSPIHAIFNSNFAKIEQRRKFLSKEVNIICAVGFEPNPHHTKHLLDMEKSYNECGWMVKFLTETAVSDHYGTTQFFTFKGHNSLEWGSQIEIPLMKNKSVV